MKLNILKKQQKYAKNNKEKSRGRSMVEMLGVLAIIGVLSIGGISGYTIAMRKYRANEIANLMTKYAFVLYQGFQNKLMNDPSFAELGDMWHDTSRPKSFNKISKKYSCSNGGHHDFFYCLGNGFEQTPFSTSGLGGLPSGIRDIQPHGLGIAENGSTVVILKLSFQDGNKELCNQINLLLGDEYQSDYGDACGSSYDPQLINGIVVDVNNADNLYNADNSDNSDNSDW